jgi:hypothetical protein
VKLTPKSQWAWRVTTAPTSRLQRRWGIIYIMLNAKLLLNQNQFGWEEALDLSLRLKHRLRHTSRFSGSMDLLFMRSAKRGLLKTDMLEIITTLNSLKMSTSMLLAKDILTMNMPVNTLVDITRMEPNTMA